MVRTVLIFDNGVFNEPIKGFKNVKYEVMFPVALKKYDTIDPEGFIEKCHFRTEEDFNNFPFDLLCVMWTHWCKDRNGVYLEVVLACDGHYTDEEMSIYMLNHTKS